MDSSLFRWINRLANRAGWAHGFFTAYAKYGIVLFAVLLIVAYLDGRRHDDLRAVAGRVWAGGAALVALGIGQLIGGAIDRARPYEAMTGVHLLVDKTTDFSFASDHATIAGAVAAGLWLVNRPLGTMATIAAVAMAFARVYVGAHYPGDVLGGLVLGAVVVVGLYKLAMIGLGPIATALARSPLRTLITSEPRTATVIDPA